VSIKFEIWLSPLAHNTLQKKPYSIKGQYFIILLITCILPTICLGFTHQSRDTIILKAEKLKKLYLLSTSASAESKKIYRQEFFEEFPNSFKQLMELYGYDFHSHKAAPLYNETEKHINELFNNLNDIDKLAYYRKIISISIGGHWDADAVNIFQGGLRQKTLEDPKLIVDVLKTHKESEIISFWDFYFDDAYPAKLIAEPLQSIKSLDNHLYNIMLTAHLKSLKQSKE